MKSTTGQHAASPVPHRGRKRLRRVIVGLAVATAAAACTSRAADPYFGLPASTTSSSPAQIYNVGHNVSDPFLSVWNGRYYLLASEGGPGTTRNVPVLSATAMGGWGQVADAMPLLPAWAEPGFTWAPDLHRFGSIFVLYFTALVRSSSPAMECIGAATGSSPSGPFTPLVKPYICQVGQGGSIDPRVFTDSRGANWMIWKSDQNIGGSPQPTKIWSAPLTDDGLAFTANPAVILRPDQAWQGTIVESPNMVEVLGTYWLFYSGNWFNTRRYAIGAALCAGPMGPCADAASTPLLASNSQGDGPGEESIFSGPTGTWLLYTPWHSDAPDYDAHPRPVAMARIGFGSKGPYVATWLDPPSPPPSEAKVASPTGPTSPMRMAPPTR